jgi:hypothetical protein
MSTTPNLPPQFDARCYIYSESHLSGYRVVIGFDSLEAAQDVHTLIANSRTAAAPQAVRPQAKRCATCDFMGEEDPVKGCPRCGFDDMHATEVPQAVQPMTWPAVRDIGRFGDMSPTAHIRVGLDSDNDVYVCVWGEDGGGCVEFCNPGGGGGGSSPRTRMALIALMVAMEADNAERPDKDWWGQRNAASQAERGR